MAICIQTENRVPMTALTKCGFIINFTAKETNKEKKSSIFQ